MKKIITLVLTLIALFTLTITAGITVFADQPTTEAVQAEAEVATDDATDSSLGSKALAAAIVVGIAAAAGAIAMGMTIAKSAESIARQPEASGKINSAMMLGLVFIETLIIYALIVAILIIFVL